MPGRMISQEDWAWLTSAIASLQHRLGVQERGTDRIMTDMYGNATYIIGNLNQTVTEGASFGVPGTQAATGLTGYGVAVYQSGAWHALASFTYP
jgi:hypothetical protein